MKINKYSFLFFCFFGIKFFFGFSLNAQQESKKDSILFYYKTITEIKDSEAISKAFNFFDTKSTEALLKNDTIKAAYYLELISLGQFKMGFYHDSESTTIEAFKLLDVIKIDPKTIAPRERLSNQLGMIYRKIGDFDNSLRFYKQALKLNKNILDKIAIETNIANIYADQNEYSKAIVSLNKFYEEALTLEKSSIKATYFDNLGFFQAKINDPIAIKNMQLALKIRLDIEDLIGAFLSYQHMSSYFLEKGSLAKALEYSNKVEVISNLINSPVYINEALKLNLKLENNPNFEKYIELNDSLEKIEQLRENKFAAIKYNVAEKERIINQRELMLKTSELQKEKQKKLKLIYLFSGLSILLISISLIIVQKSKHKKEKLQQVYNAETRISKKVHDEVANDMFQFMTKLQIETSTSEDLIDDLELIYNKTRDISKEHSVLDLEGGFEDILNDLILSYNRLDISVIAKGVSQVHWEAMSEIKRITMYKVLQELLINMKKHSQASVVVLSFDATNKNTLISYTDNGVGCNLKKGTGVQNMENRIDSINGTITFESKIEKGFKVKIVI